ncbi:FFLEELY motif protein [Arenimonas fontis]|uniref:DUF8198 domain-containing protein n=1 Tax=Arenimonas fontis TaxID=2608255 RepID=A0A5B2ZCW7_9GAMM|nr:hypothetical protein [Arenimonas fontis]KAA2285996.1 hypothetical protein F0415_00375 [Arenimonas fontis]
MSEILLRRRLARRLAWQRRLNDPVAEPRNRLATLPPLRAWQADRLRASFRDFLERPGTRAAAQFFLDDLYGDRDFSGRDRDAARVLPAMVRLLPAALSEAAVEAVELAVLSHAFDLAMATVLAKRPDPHAPITMADYGQAYRETGCPRLRRHQIGLILSLGRTLEAAVRLPGVGRLLRASRLPARLAGVSELQGFLERGFAAFAGLEGAGRFLDAIAEREYAASRRLFAGDPDPFRLNRKPRPGNGGSRSRPSA